VDKWISGIRPPPSGARFTAGSPTASGTGLRHARSGPYASSWITTLSWQAEGGRLLGADTAPGDNWDRIRAAFDALLSDPSQLTGSVAEFGGIPKQELAGFLIGDLLIHSWDLARSVGANEALPPDAVEATTIGLHHVPPGLLRGTNPLGQKMMAAAVKVSADASPQDKMLAFTGRRP